MGKKLRLKLLNICIYLQLKIGVEDWKDSPDRQILEMGGVKTEHAER